MRKFQFQVHSLQFLGVHFFCLFQKSCVSFASSEELLGSSASSDSSSEEPAEIDTVRKRQNSLTVSFASATVVNIQDLHSSVLGDTSLLVTTNSN